MAGQLVIGGARRLAAWILVAAAFSTVPAAWGGGVCAKVRIQISQRMGLTRSAFRATLDVINQDSSETVSNVAGALRITTDLALDAPQMNSLFAGADEPEASGIGAGGTAGTGQNMSSRG